MPFSFNGLVNLVHVHAMLCHKGSESHVSNSVRVFERSGTNYALVIKAFNESLVKKTFFQENSTT